MDIISNFFTAVGEAIATIAKPTVVKKEEIELEAPGGIQTAKAKAATTEAIGRTTA